MAVIFDNEKKSKVVFDEPKSKVVFDDEGGVSIGGIAKQAGIGFGNEALLGLPLGMMKKFQGEDAVKNLESQQTPERIARGVGTTAGLIVGLPKLAFSLGSKAAVKGGRLLLGAEKASKINRFAKGAAKAGAGAGAFELLRAPDESFKEKVISVPTATLFGAAVGPLIEGASEQVTKFLSNKGLIQKGKVAGTKELEKLNSIIDASKAEVDEPVKLQSKRIEGIIKTQLLDRHYLVRNMEESVERNIGRKLPFKVSVKDQLDRYLGTQGIIEGHINRYGRELKKVGKYVDSLEQVKTAQRLLERAQRGFENPQGATLEEANKMLQDIRGSVGDKVYQQLLTTAEQHRRLLRRILHKAKNSGFLDDDDLKNILDKNQFYSPFEVLDYMGDNVSKFARGQGFRTTKPGAFSAVEGTEKNILNPIDSEIRYMSKVVSAIEKNDVKRKFVGLIEFDKGLESIIRPLKVKTPFPKQGLVVANIGADGKLYVGKPGELHFNLFEKFGKQIRKKMNLKSGEPTFKKTGFVDKSGKFLTREEALKRVRVKPTIKGELDASDLREQTGRFDLDKGFVTKSGEKVEFAEKFLDVPEGFQKVSLFKDGIKQEYAVEESLAKVLNGLNSHSIDYITKTAAHFSRALRAGATTFNASFFIPNLFRDFQQAKLTSEVGFSVADWVKGLSSTLKKDVYYQRWLKNGGGFSGIQQILRQTTPSIKNELAPSISRKVGEYTNPFKWLAKVSQVSETSTRLGVFRRGLEKGLNMQQAVSNSRNASIDFARMGEAMQIANLWVPFLNARTQGLVNIISAAKRNPKKFAVTATGIIVAPQLATYAWNTTKYPDVWDDIREFEKENNFIMIYGREKDEEGLWTQVARIPKGDVGKALGNSLESFLEMTRGEDPEFGETMFKVLSDVLPVDFEREGELSGAALGASLLPPPIKAYVETVTNQNLFTGRDIVPQRLKKASPGEQFTDKTSPIAIGIGKLLNISPLKIENMAGTLFGSVGRQVINPLEAPKSLSRRFVGAIGDQDQQDQFEILEDIVMDSEDISVNDWRLARQSLNQFKQLPPVPEIRKEFINKTFKGKTKAFERFSDMVLAEANGEKPIIRALKVARVKDRFRFIREYSQTLNSDEERIQFLMLLFNNKVITPKSLERLE